MKTVAFTTLGCRVNQYDTDAMKGLFLQNNYEAVDFDEKADIYVINTCSVTNMGEKKSRQLIRKAKRQNEDAYVIVTGCYAQLDPDAIAAIDGVNLVIGTNNRSKIVELVEQLESTERQINAIIESGGKSVSLGNTILRAETAAIGSLSMIQYELEL